MWLLLGDSGLPLFEVASLDWTRLICLISEVLCLEPHAGLSVDLLELSSMMRGEYLCDANGIGDSAYSPPLANGILLMSSA